MPRIPKYIDQVHIYKNVYLSKEGVLVTYAHEHFTEAGALAVASDKPNGDRYQYTIIIEAFKLKR